MSLDGLISFWRDGIPYFRGFQQKGTNVSKSEKQPSSAGPDTVDNDSTGQNVVKLSERALAAIKIGGVDFKPTARVTIPTLSHKYPEVMDVAVMFEGPFLADISKDDEGRDKVVHVARVVDLTTGQVCRYVGGAIVVRELEGLEGGYVGRSFAIRKMKKPEGKRYNQVEILEIA
jgi:hypothetical protein